MLGQFLDLQTNFNFDVILSTPSLAFKLDKISLKNYSQSHIFFTSHAEVNILNEDIFKQEN